MSQNVIYTIPHTRFKTSLKKQYWNKNIKLHQQINTGKKQVAAHQPMKNSYLFSGQYLWGLTLVVWTPFSFVTITKWLNHLLFAIFLQMPLQIMPPVNSQFSAHIRVWSVVKHNSMTFMLDVWSSVVQRVFILMRRDIWTAKMRLIITVTNA